MIMALSFFASSMPFPLNGVSKERGSYVFRLRGRVDVRKHCEGERL